MQFSDPSAGHRPLSGLRVVTAVDERLPELGKCLVDLGATVDVLNSVAARRDVAGLRLNERGKRFHDESGDIAPLLSGAAVLICSPDGIGGGLGATPEALAAEFPRAVVAVVSDFGLTGRRANWFGTEAVFQALGGVLARSGEPGRPPLIPPGSLFLHGAAQAIAYSILVAVFGGLRAGGRGALLDCSIFEHGMTTFDPSHGMTGSGTPDAVTGRGRPDAGAVYPVVRAADGYVRFCLLARGQWLAMRDWMGDPPELAGDDLLTNPGRWARAKDLVVPALARFFATKTVDDIVDECRARRIPGAAVLSLSRVLAEPHYLETGILRTETTDGGAVMTFPEGMVSINGRRSVPLRPSEPAGGDWVVAGESPSVVMDSAVGGPLSGITVLDLGVIVAGAQTGQLLAEQGARVIRIENTAFPDGMRRSFDWITPAQARGHMGKENLGLNLRDPKGLEALRALVARADVVCTNFKPGTAEKLGIGHAELMEINPRLIVVESSAFGDTGPWRSAMGYGPLVRAATGLTGLWREGPDATYFGDGITTYPDHLAARVSGAAIIAALLDRLRTGRGAVIRVAQSDIALVALADLVATESLTPGSVVAPGAEPGALLGRRVFRTAGDEGWCVIDPRTADQVAALRGALGIRGTGSGLDDVVADAVSGRHAEEVAEELQALGVPAAAMLLPSELADDAALAEREFFIETSVSGTGENVLVERSPVMVDGRRAAPLPAAEAFGQHTRAVLAELGYDSGEIEAMLASGAAEECAAVAAEHDAHVGKTI